ncbi:hypothetical protein QA601_18560 [Chitinispirillales bacterium ANBcel5]|uniref:hypothetical protein n=1 Tax=Cellulosispirillum alkaliphilum TaxID=3039283 RepID=UPI002A57DE32|nr:hypothetical protein [Chitinispirillales bacterium ANBcel5]
MKFKSLIRQIGLFGYFFFSVTTNTSNANEINNSLNYRDTNIVKERDLSLVFEASKKDFLKLWNELEEISLPIESPFPYNLPPSEMSYPLPGFKYIPGNLVPFFGVDYFYAHMIAKLPPIGNNKIFLLAVTEDSNERLLFIGSITNSISLLNISLVMDYSHEGVHGVLGKQYKISEEYKIIISEYFSPYTESVQGDGLIKKEIYSINSKGEFIVVQE